MDGVGDISVESDLVRESEGKAGVVGVGIVDVRFDAVEALGLALLEPGLEDRSQDRPLTNVDVALVRVPGHCVAEHTGRVIAGVRSVALPGPRLQVTERFVPRGVDLGDQGGDLSLGTRSRGVVVDVVHLDGADVGRDGDGPVQVVLPRGERAGLPPGGGSVGRLVGY